MSLDEPDTPEWPPAEGRSELVERLRRLRWPEVSPEARQRCWEQLSRQVAALRDSPAPKPDPAAGPAAWHEQSQENPRGLRRLEFAGRAPEGSYKGALAERVAVARGATGRGRR